jgi:hypothetical protein
MATIHRTLQITSTMQTHVILSNEAAAWLDEECAAARRTRGAALSRSKLLRGIIAGLMRVNADLSHCATEEDVATLIAVFLQMFERGSARFKP